MVSVTMWCGIWAVAWCLVMLLCARLLRAQMIARLALMVICSCMIVACSTVALAARTYMRLTSEQPIARIRCTNPSGVPSQFMLEYTQLHPQEQPTQTFQMIGDQWLLTGDIIKWHPWLELLGLHTIHKPTQLTGRFLHAADAQGRPRSTYALNGGSDPWWIYLAKATRRPLGIHAVYGAGTYTFAISGADHIVHVTSSGYLIK